MYSKKGLVSFVLHINQLVYLYTHDTVNSLYAPKHTHTYSPFFVLLLIFSTLFIHIRYKIIGSLFLLILILFLYLRSSSGRCATEVQHTVCMLHEIKIGR